MARRRRGARHNDALPIDPENALPPAVTRAKSRPADLARARRPRRHGCWGHLVVAPLWVAFRANLGTLARTCDATGACLAVPDTPHYREALAVGNTLGRRQPCLHWVR